MAEETKQLVRTTFREPVEPFNATIVHSTYANVFAVVDKADEFVLMFGQVPLLPDGTVLTTRIYLTKELAKTIAETMTAVLAEKEKAVNKEGSDDGHTYG